MKNFAYSISLEIYIDQIGMHSSRSFKNELKIISLCLTWSLCKGIVFPWAALSSVCRPCSFFHLNVWKIFYSYTCFYIGTESQSILYFLSRRAYDITILLWTYEPPNIWNIVQHWEAYFSGYLVLEYACHRERLIFYSLAYVSLLMRDWLCNTKNGACRPSMETLWLAGLKAN